MISREHEKIEMINVHTSMTLEDTIKGNGDYFRHNDIHFKEYAAQIFTNDIYAPIAERISHKQQEVN